MQCTMNLTSGTIRIDGINVSGIGELYFSIEKKNAYTNKNMFRLH